MDPITAALLLCLALGWTAKAAGGGVAHAAAAIRGKPSPTVQKWEAQEKARRAAGHPARQRPKSPFRVAWQNAVEKRVVKMEQRHHGHLTALRELGPEVSKKAKHKLLKRVDRRAKLAAGAAKWFGAGRSRFARIAEDLKQVVAEKRAEVAGRRAGTEQDAEPDRQQQAQQAVEQLDNDRQGSTENTDSPEGTPDNVVDLDSRRSKEDSTEDNADAQPATTENSTDEQPSNADSNPSSDSPSGGFTMSTPTAPAEQVNVPEIADLATAIQYTETVGGHLANLAAKIGEDATIAQNNASAMETQSATIENGQAALSTLGFDSGEIQDGLATAAELIPAAAQNLGEVARLLPTIGEQLEQVAQAMSTAKAALEAQRGLADEVQTQAAAAGVARETAFYQEG